VSVFCPMGSAEPTPASAGYYTFFEVATPSGDRNYGGDDRDRSRGDRDHSGGAAIASRGRAGQRICERGFFCVGGERFPCPAGTFGAAEGLVTSSCSGR